MYTRTEILDRLQEFLDFSISKSPDFEAEFTSLMQPVFTAVNGYFNTDRSAYKKPLNDLELYLHNYLWQREVEWEHPYDFGLDSNLPYNDLRKMFYQFPLMNTTTQEFYDAWVWGIPEDESGLPIGDEPIPLSHPMVPSWSTEINNYPPKELDRVNSLNAWLESSMSQSSPVMLWEDTGTLIRSPERVDLAQIVFIDLGLREATEILGLPAYIPTYLRK